MQIIDTHQHLWDLERFSYTWCRSYPQLHRSFLPEDYRAATSGCDVLKSVHVEADVDPELMLDETRWILSLADDSRTPIEGVVACCRPESENFREYLDALGAHSKVKGLRRVLHIQPDELAQSPLFVENLRVLPQYGLSFDINVLARQLPVALHLVQQCPEVSFILDHCGNPRVREKELDPWRAHIAEIARHPNVVCKVSGIVAAADTEHWTAEDLRPYVEHVIECFGWDRILWGSDWPVCLLSASFGQWLEAALQITRHENETNRRKLFHDNAVRVYRL